MTYNEFQRRRTVWRDKELKERAEDIASPRPPLNNSITDQAIRELYDRVATLEGGGLGSSKSASILEPGFAPTQRAFSLPSGTK